eukprot:1145394-Pelagomonas_calceolata.AAC.1
MQACLTRRPSNRHHPASADHQDPPCSRTGAPPAFGRQRGRSLRPPARGKSGQGRFARTAYFKTSVNCAFSVADHTFTPLGSPSKAVLQHLAVSSCYVWSQGLCLDVDPSRHESWPPSMRLSQPHKCVCVWAQCLSSNADPSWPLSNASQPPQSAASLGSTGPS